MTSFWFQTQTASRDDSVALGGDRPIVGLHRMVTGQPVFVLVLPEPMATGLHVLRDESDVWAAWEPLLREEKAAKSPGVLERVAISALQAFFRAGGRSLLLWVVRDPGGERLIGDRYREAVLGPLQGASAADAASAAQRLRLNRHGMLGLKDYETLGDVLAFPQAGALLDPDALQDFYQRVGSITETMDPWMVWVDVPLNFCGAEEGTAWLAPFDAPHMMAVGPWLSLDASGARSDGSRVEGSGFFAPSVLASVFVQISDATHSVADVPANWPLPFGGFSVSPLDAHALRSTSRLNYFEFTPDVNGRKMVQLWGDRTLSQRQDESRWVHVSRTLRALRWGLTHVVQPYLFEPKSPTTCEALKATVESFLAQCLDRRVLRRPRSGGDAYSVTLETEDRGGPVSYLDASVHLNVEVCIDALHERIGLYVSI